MPTTNHYYNPFVGSVEAENSEKAKKIVQELMNKDEETIVEEDKNELDITGDGIVDHKDLSKAAKVLKSAQITK